MTASATTPRPWRAACPACRSELGDLQGTQLACRSCGVEYVLDAQTWRMVAGDRRPAIDAFVTDYTTIRHAEGRGSLDPDYYLRLPEPTQGDPLGWQWTMRATTWRHVRRRVLPKLGSGLRVLDLGAGVGWLSHRLGEMGHWPVAVDLSVDDLDGLGAARHYPHHWPRIQAEFDRLPLVDQQVDLVIFNASLHYSVDYDVTLAEARRVTRPRGWVLILDSPVYRRDESGRQMAAERHAQFEAAFGTRSESMPSIEFLSENILQGLSQRTGVVWRRSIAWYGLTWWLRPFRARRQGKREPSRFITLLGQWPD